MKNKTIINIIILTILVLFNVAPSYSAHRFLEKDYQNAWCSSHHGKAEVVLIDQTRVDCVTDAYAVEVDFAAKWAEGIGQSLYYAYMTGKKPAVLLIIESSKDFKYLNRLKVIARQYNITVFTIDPNSI